MGCLIWVFFLENWPCYNRTLSTVIKCHNNMNASLTQLMLGYQTTSTSLPNPCFKQLGTWAKGVKPSCHDYPQGHISLFPYRWHKPKTSHLLECHHTQFRILLWSNTQTVGLCCPKNAIIRPAWLAEATKWSRCLKRHDPFTNICGHNSTEPDDKSQNVGEWVTMFQVVCT